MLREIPSLQTLCLRAIGPHSCSVEETFAKSKTGEPSSASRLLRSFHQRPIAAPGSSASASTSADASGNSSTELKPAAIVDADQKDADSTICKIPMERTPCIGKGSARRANANEVDLHHPVVACRIGGGGASNDDGTSNNKGVLILQHANPALDCLQSYYDSLVELGRMDDSRLGLHFFEEWRANVLLGAGEPVTPKVKSGAADSSPSIASSKKRRRGGTPVPTQQKLLQQQQQQYQNVPIGSLSLYNCTLGTDTIEAMVESGMGPHLAVLDLTGTHGLNDHFLSLLLPVTPNMTRLGVKNCRRLTSEALSLMAKYTPKLTSLDIGGCFNIEPKAILEVAVPALTAMTELHCSGLGWTNESIADLTDMREWKSLALGFSLRLTQSSLRQSLMTISTSLTALSLPFCESVMDNAILGILGRNLPLVGYLDVRGNPGLSTLTGWYDGRASADLPAQSLLVLGRYSGLQDSSVDDTRRIHPNEASTDLLTVIIDGGGMGAAISRGEEATRLSV
jgi:hypothetical protein